MAKKKYYGMLDQNKSKPSNLPTEVIMKEYGSLDYISSDVDDTMSGMDALANSAVSKAKKQLAKKPY